MFQEKKIKFVFKNLLSQLSVKRMFGLTAMCVMAVLVFAHLQPITAQAAGGITLSAIPTSRTIYAGQSATYTINIARNNYTGNVTLNASNLPTGATYLFSPNPTTGKISILTVTTKTSTPTGTFQIKVSGSATGITIAPINVTLVVNPAPSVTMSAIPATQSIIAGQSVTYKIKLARTNYDGPVTLSAANLPAGITASFEPNPVYSNESTMRIYSHGLPHVWKDYDFSIKATIRNGLVTDLPIRLIANCAIVWVEQFGTTQIDVHPSGTGDTYQSVAVDSSGNSYVVGDTYVPGQASEVWVAKYNSFGQQEWFKSFGAPGEFDDRVLDVAVDSSGYVFLGGYTNGEFPGNANQGGFDFWIAKYDSAGSQLWIRQDGTLREDGANGFEIVPDGSGGGTFTTFQNDRRDVVTYSFNSSNGSISFQDSFQIPLQYTTQPWDIALGPNNTVVVVGGLTTLTAYLLVYDNQSSIQLFADSIFIQDSNIARRAVVDTTGKIYVAGTSQDCFNGSCTDNNAWVRIYTPSGNTYSHVQKMIQSSGEDFINALAIDNNGDLIAAGKTTGILGESNGGGEDAWVARLTNTVADLVWIRQFPVAGNDSVETLAITVNGDPIMAGYTSAFKAATGSQDALLIWYSVTTTTRFPPVITGFSSPTTGQSITGARVGETVRINGGNFGLIGTPTVRFNGVPAATLSSANTFIDAIVPQGATTGYVTVTRSCECFRSPAQFTVLP
jgi:hypothetical protein